MAREFLSSLNPTQINELKQELLAQRGNACYICDEPINLAGHPTDIDHIVALALGGADNKSNLAVAHSSCNRSKGIRDLQLQRYIAFFRKLVTEQIKSGTLDESITVGDVLVKHKGSRVEVALAYLPDNFIQLSFQIDSTPYNLKFNILQDSQNDKVVSFVGMLPIEILFHDPAINPRSIADLEPLIEEFYQKRPQLQPSLGYLTLDANTNSGQIKLFDGQHKAAAQVVNGASVLFTRVFLNPDMDVIVKTNFRAHTKLSQIHFPQLISDKVGHSIFAEEFAKYQSRADVDKDSEKKFIESLSRELKSEYSEYLKSYLKYEALTSTSVKLMSYVETLSARSKTFPLAFESLKKGILDILLFLKPSDEPLSLSQQMRIVERENIQTIMNILAEEILINRFNPSIGIFKIEQRLQNDDPKITTNHLLAYRMLRQAPLIAWCEQLKDAIVTYLTSNSKYKMNWNKDKYLWVSLDDRDKGTIRKMVKFVMTHSAWTVKDETITKQVSSTKVNEWRTIITQGKLPGAPTALYDSMNSGAILTKSLQMN